MENLTSVDKLIKEIRDTIYDKIYVPKVQVFSLDEPASKKESSKKQTKKK